MVDNAPASAVTSRSQQIHQPRRSARLNTNLSAEKPLFETRTPLRPTLQPNTGNKKRIREEDSLEDNKRRCTSSLQHNKHMGSVEYWCSSGYRWPPKDWPRDSMDKNPAMNRVLARKRSTSSLRRKRSESESGDQRSTIPSDQKSRESKSAPYRDPRYTTVLATKGSFMDKDKLGISQKSKDLVQKLLDQEQQVPQGSLFQDDLFERTCRNITDRNETRVIRDIALLLVPSAEILTNYGASELECLVESVNEGWNNSIPVTQTRPQPDYAVGFRRGAFTEEQLARLRPFVGDLTDQSLFMATFYLYFPFLTCEVKCGGAALDVADRQNAHSMTLAVRAVVELFRLVGREKELDREILAFSISHDHDAIRLYGHYPVVEGAKTNFYRHPIHKFSFTTLDGKDKWTAHKFTKNIYFNWMPDHFARLCSVIDTLPADLDFEVSQSSELNFSEQTGLSQSLADQELLDEDSQLQLLPGTPDTSFTEHSRQTGAKKARKGRGVTARAARGF